MSYKRKLWFLGAFLVMGGTMLVAGSAGVSRRRKSPLLVAPRDAYELSELLKQLYLPSFPPIVEKEKTEEEREKEKNRKTYDIEVPELMARKIVDLLLSKVYTERNRAYVSLFEEKRRYRAELLPLTAVDAKLYRGTLANPENSYINTFMRRGDFSEIGRGVMAIRMMLPIDHIPSLRGEQAVVRKVVVSGKLRRGLEALSRELQAIEPSLISLFQGSKDPLFTKAYKSSMRQLVFKFSEQGRYTSWFWTEFKRRLFLEIFGFGTILAFGKIFFDASKVIFDHLRRGYSFSDMSKRLTKWLNEDPKNSITFSNMFVSVFMTPFYIWMMYTNYSTHLTMYRYIARRIYDVQRLVLAADRINTLLKSDPELEALLGEKLTETRRLLGGRHPKAAYNELIRRCFETDFSWWNVFFSSPGTLLTTYTLLEENLGAIESIIFELGNLETYLAMAMLVKRSRGKRNGYAFPKYIEKEEIYLSFPGLWNPLIGVDKAVSNQALLDSSKIHTLCITGPNGCGKSQYNTAIMMGPYQGQVIYVVSARGGETLAMTPISAFLIFKEPHEDPAEEKSLFMSEIELAMEMLYMLIRSKKHKKKILISLDEFFRTTNPKEGISLEYGFTDYIAKNFDHCIMVISTHNPYLIDQCLSDKRAKVVQVVIRRNADGSYRALYKVADGKSEEKVGIDLCEREMKKDPELDKARKEIISKARKRYREMNKKKSD